MKSCRIFLELFFILGILFLSIGIAAGIQIDHFYPAEGTSSVYRWNFDGFPSICSINSEVNDSNEFDSYVCIDNPTYAEFSVSYEMSNLFLKEVVEGFTYNASASIKMLVSYLINTSSREYVNEEWEGIDMGYANGYIDPRNLSIGVLVMVGNTEVETVAKEVVKITGTSREAWKLETLSGNFNQTLHYDVLTGILLNAKLETYGGTIGHAAGVIDLKQEIYTREQILITTNAWESVKVTNISLFMSVLGLLLVIIRTRRKRNITLPS